MPAEVSWYVPEKVVYVRYTGIVTTADIVSSYTGSRDHASQAPQPAHIIMDSLKVQKMDFTIKEIKTLLANFDASPIAWAVNITATDAMSSKASNFLISIINQSLGLRFRTSKTLAEAHEFLNSIDMSLADVLPKLE